MAQGRAAAAVAVLLVLSVAAFAPLAAATKIVVNVGDLNTRMVTSLGKLKRNTLELTSVLVPPVSSCELTAQIQTGDTCSSFSEAFRLSTSSLLDLNPGLDCNIFTPSATVCVGGAGSACNCPLDINGQCPDWSNGAKLVPATGGGIKLSSALRTAFTSTPDVWALLNDPETYATKIKVNGTASVLMVIPGVSAVVKAVQSNPGHPFLSLWAASGPTEPLVIAVLPGWFSNTGGLIAYVPGATFKDAPGGKRNLLAIRKLLQRGGSYPGSSYYQGGGFYGR